MPRSLVLAFFFLTGLSAYAQPEPQFTQYMYNRFLFNPAYAGSGDALEARLLHRSQYTGLTSRWIATQGFNFSLPIYSISSGVGVNVINDLIGYQRSTYITASYDYRKDFKWGKMGIGLSAGIIQTSLDGSQLQAPDGDYHDNVNHNDDYLPATLQQGIAPDVSLGIYFNSNKYFAGVSANHLLLSSAPINSPSRKLKLNFARELMVMGGYDFRLSKGVHCMPSALIKTDLRKVQLDLSANFTIIDNILTGISFRGYNKNSIDALALMAGFRIKGFQLVYSYDANLSSLAHFNGGSHEVSLGYVYPLKKRETRGYFYHNARFN